MMSSKHTNVSETLAVYRAERRQTVQALRQNLAAQRQMLQLDVADMRRTFQQENEQAAAQTRAELAAFRHELELEVAALRRDQRDQQSGMAAEQAQALALFRGRLAADVQEMLQTLQAERAAMAQAQRQELSMVRPALRADVLALRRGFYYGVQDESVAGIDAALDFVVDVPLEHHEDGNEDADEPTAVSTPQSAAADYNDLTDSFADLFADDAVEEMDSTPPVEVTLIDLHGIGPKTEHLLNKIGIMSVVELAHADVNALYEAMGQAIPLSKIEEWIAAANTAVDTSSPSSNN